MKYYRKMTTTPAGELTLIASDKGLSAILWQNDDPMRVRLSPVEDCHIHPLLLQTEEQLLEYFTGKRRVFSLPIDVTGTDFQKQVWKALLAIPYGQTLSYSEIGLQIGRPKAARAVGAASGKNPVSIVIPCHRVIGRNGQLTGFAGGLQTKSRLLSLERSDNSFKLSDTFAGRPCDKG